MTNIKTLLARLKKKILKSIYKVSDRITGGDALIRYTYFQNGYHNPNYTFSKKEIAFIHLPKTAGTSMADLLWKDEKSQFINLDIHRPIAKGYSPDHYNYITIIRDPIDRVWSLYQMVLRSGIEYPYHNYAVKGLEEYVSKCWAAQNMATRYISGEVQKEPSIQTLQIAKKNLKQFHKVISFENFEQEATEFLSDHKIPFDKIPNQRKSAYDQPTDEQRAFIKKYNQLDISLFDYWKKEC